MINFKRIVTRKFRPILSTRKIVHSHKKKKMIKKMKTKKKRTVDVVINMCFCRNLSIYVFGNYCRTKRTFVRIRACLYLDTRHRVRMAFSRFKHVGCLEMNIFFSSSSPKNSLSIRFAEDD